MAARVLILAQDLIWLDRLSNAVAAAGAEPTRATSSTAFAASLDAAEFAVVDLTARAYDGIAAVAAASDAGARVLAVGQHDDVDLRKRALASGADKVLAYRKLFEDGPATIAAWLAS
jgi:DNA-binding response OmpR family regulator